MNSRMPSVRLTAPLPSIGAKRSYSWLWPERTRSAPLSYSSFQIGCMNVLLPPLPVLKRGWCQKASVQVAGCAARSFCSHVYCAEPTSQPPAAVQLEFSAMTCQPPMSVE